MCIVLFPVFIIIGYNFHWIYYSGLILVFFLINSIIKLKEESLRIKISYEWGIEKSKKRSFSDLKEFYSLYRTEQTDLEVDDQTWSDLNLDDVYTVIDRTYTSPGENFLYGMLRKPLYDHSEINRRKEIISFFQNSDPSKEEILLTLAKLNLEDSNRTADLLWGNYIKESPFRHLFTFLFISAAASLISIPYLGQRSILVISSVFFVNSIVYLIQKNRYSHLIPSIKYLSKIIKTAGIIKATGIKELDFYNSILSESCLRAEKLSKKIKYLEPKIPIDIFNAAFDYINMFFLNELRTYYSSAEEIKNNIDHLRQIYLIIGEIDALQSVASYRKYLKKYCEPVFIQDNRKMKSFITAQDIYHPLLEKPVTNSISFSNKGIMITGSNMAGKSTFLRTVGLNALFAQTICTCLSSNYESCYVKIISSINQSDDINTGKSFYFSESERLLKIIQSSHSKILTLCIIDELLAGTNSFERLIASEEILKYLISENALIVAATHDITLAENLKHIYSCYHFNDDVDEKGLNFDYTLKPGISSTSNAIKLLEYLGYPEEIYKNAHAKAYIKESSVN